MRKVLKYILLAFLFVALILIRGFENKMFYDPLLIYFQNNYLHQGIPEINEWKLMLNILYRFGLNSVITLGIIYVFFENKSYVKFTAFFLICAFIILIVVFAFLLQSEFNSGYLFPFYVRRFLIHPLFLLLLLPAFYYQKIINSKI